ncbi:hypothetical protein BDZ97DRAFT_1779189 [Flammula alnicola]|nr:hypothetical protein BDZ97DRAFT_1779189 [Flammula alnicola]
MSHSTTGTSSYVLSKYSRSYPIKRTLQKSQLHSSNGPETMADWQHFTNPIIRLVLDVKTTSSKEIESVRLRILWQMNPGPDSGFGQQDVLFEDLDLLSFSAIACNVPLKQQTEGLPLKAVYRDTVVGIRYFYCREDGVTPVYRRFQISFQSTSEAADFIEIIKPVCPCKLNPTSAPSAAPSFAASQNLNLLNRSTIRTHTNLPISNSLLPHRGSHFAYQPVFSDHPPSIGQTSFVKTAHIPTKQTPVVASHTSSLLPLRHDVPLGVSSDPGLYLPLDSRSSPARPAIDAAMQPVGHQLPDNRNLPQREPTARQEILSLPSINVILTEQTNLPSSSLPSLPGSDTSNQVKDPPLAFTDSSEPQNAQKDIPHPVLASLVEATSIYNLSNTALEQVIAEVIHEDRFIELVRSRKSRDSDPF